MSRSNCLEGTVLVEGLETAIIVQGRPNLNRYPSFITIIILTDEYNRHAGLAHKNHNNNEHMLCYCGRLLMSATSSYRTGKLGR